MSSGTGTTVIDFGTGSTTAQATVSVPTIEATHKVEAWLVPIATASNTADAHWLEDLVVMAGPAKAGVGFTIYGICRTLQAHGQYTVNYVYAQDTP